MLLHFITCCMKQHGMNVNILEMGGGNAQLGHGCVAFLAGAFFSEITPAFSEKTCFGILGVETFNFDESLSAGLNTKRMDGIIHTFVNMK